MPEADLRQRYSQSVPEPLPDLGAGSGGKASEPHPAGKVKYGPWVQLLRMLLFATWLNGCAITILMTQLIGTPLYLISRDYYYAWMAKTKQSFSLLQLAAAQVFAPSRVKVSWDSSMRGHFRKAADGTMQSQIPERLVLISNHQIYTDWAFLWWTAYTARMDGYIYIVLKESLKWVPIVGWGMHFYSFIFMARKWASDKVRIQYRLQKLKTRHGGPMSGSPGLDPMWLMIFPEGTNLSANTRKGSVKWAEKQGIPDLKHALLPRSTGLQFCLEELQGTVDWVYDCTLGYEGVTENMYAQDYFTLRSTYFQGRSPKSVSMYWRRYALADIPIKDPKAFEIWLLHRWQEKDKLLAGYYETGRFPSDSGPTGTKTQGEDNMIEVDMRLRHWFEVFQIFAVLLTTAMVVNVAAVLWARFR